MKKVRLENYHWALKASAFATCKTSALDEVGSKTMAWADRNELFNLFIMFEQCMFVSPECIVFFFTLGLSWRLDCLLSEHMDSDFCSCLCKEIWKRSHTKKKTKRFVVLFPNANYQTSFKMHNDHVCKCYV